MKRGQCYDILTHTAVQRHTLRDPRKDRTGLANDLFSYF